jgi:hypothetical protein
LCSEQLGNVLAAKNIIDADLHWDRLLEALGGENSLSKVEILCCHWLITFDYSSYFQEQTAGVIRTGATALDGHPYFPLLLQAKDHYDSFDSQRASHRQKLNLVCT